MARSMSDLLTELAAIDAEAEERSRTFFVRFVEPEAEVRCHG